MEQLLTLTEKAARRIRNSIIRREFKSGEMVCQRKIAKDLGVSPIVIRESLRILEKDGLVENIPKWGTRVINFDLKRLKGQYLVREALEGAVARMAVETVKDEELAPLFSLADKVDYLLVNPADPFEAASTHYDFHMAIARLSDCKEIIDSLERINLQYLIWLTNRIIDLKKIKQPPAWHRKIIEALAARDPDEAERVVRLHVRSGFENVLELFGEGKHDTVQSSRFMVHG